MPHWLFLTFELFLCKQYVHYVLLPPLWTLTFCDLDGNLAYPKGIPSPIAPCPHPIYISRSGSKVSMLLAVHCCFKLLPSCLPTQISDLVTLKTSSYATSYPPSLLHLTSFLLIPFHFLKTPVPVLRGFLHPLVNLSDFNVRIKDLSKKKKKGWFVHPSISSPEPLFPSCLFPSHCLTWPHAEPHHHQCLYHLKSSTFSTFPLSSSFTLHSLQIFFKLI